MVRAQFSDWQAHTSFRDVRAVVAAEEAVYASTSGGVFGYHRETGAIRRYTVIDGLHDVASQALAPGGEPGDLWVGYQDGALDLLDTATGEVETFLDITRTDRFPSREVHRLLARGDSLFVATAFGLVVFDAVRKEVRDSYTRFGTFAAGVPVFDSAVQEDESLWVATENGLARAPLDAPNLQDPAVWTTFSFAGGAVRHLCIADGAVYAGSDDGLWILQEDLFQRVGTVSDPVQDLRCADGEVVALFESSVATVAGASFEAVEPLANLQMNAFDVTEGRFWIGSSRFGLAEVRRSPLAVAQTIVPEGPLFNEVSDLRVDSEGDLWVGGGPGTFAGFYRFRPDSGWTNYSKLFVDALAGEQTRFETVHTDARGGWAGSFGGGLAHVQPDGSLRLFGTSNSTLGSASSAGGEFVIVRGLDTDSQGNLWVTNLSANQPLHVYDSEENWSALPGEAGPLATYHTIAIDEFDRKWIALRSRSNLNAGSGLLVLDTRGTHADPQDDRAVTFAQGSNGQGLPSTLVTDLAVDPDGNVWIATDEGPALHPFGGTVFSGSTGQLIWPQFPIGAETESPFLLNGLRINGMAVDPASQIWMATDQGAFLVREEEGGYVVAERLTEENSPLLSNRVVSVAVDPESGRVYFATSKGLVSATGAAVAAETEVGALTVYPNPLRLNEGMEPRVCVEGLVADATVRLVTIDGRRMVEVEGRGGQRCFDARTPDGDLLPSGVYIVVATSPDQEAAYGKLAVLR